MTKEWGEGERKGVSEEGEERRRRTREAREEGGARNRTGCNRAEWSRCRVGMLRKTGEEEKCIDETKDRLHGGALSSRPALHSFHSLPSTVFFMPPSHFFSPVVQSCAGKTASSCRDSRRQPVPGGRPEFEFLIIKHQTNRMP
ncbi:unnamed protein product [Calypogeia fissa]